VRRAVFLVAIGLVGLVLPACHHAKSAPGDPGGSGAVGPADSGSTTSITGHTASSLAAGTPTTSGSRSTGTTSPAQRTTTTAAPNQVDTGAKDGVGAYARTLLRPSPATSVVIEVFEQSVAEPVQNTLNNAVSVWHANSQKPVSTAGPVSVPGGAQSWTADDLRNTADRLTQTPQSTTRAVVHVLFLHGTFQGDDTILGISVRGDTAAVFEDAVQSSGTAIAPRSRIEDAVTEHELGHILGLVDLVLHTGRGDPQHPGHSTNKKSVMYWAVESNLVSQILGGPPPVDFDDADRTDLATIRNGG